jgi:hypothetical protein
MGETITIEGAVLSFAPLPFPSFFEQLARKNSMANPEQINLKNMHASFVQNYSIIAEPGVNHCENILLHHQDAEAGLGHLSLVQFPVLQKRILGFPQITNRERLLSDAFFSTIAFPATGSRPGKDLPLNPGALSCCKRT